MKMVETQNCLRACHPFFRMLTLKEPEYLVNLKAGGGAESARGGFRAPVWSISMQTIHKRVSNES